MRKTLVLVSIYLIFLTIINFIFFLEKRKITTAYIANIKVQVKCDLDYVVIFSEINLCRIYSEILKKKFIIDKEIEQSEIIEINTYSSNDGGFYINEYFQTHFTVEAKILDNDNLASNKLVKAIETAKELSQKDINEFGNLVYFFKRSNPQFSNYDHIDYVLKTINETKTDLIRLEIESKKEIFKIKNYNKKLDSMNYLSLNMSLLLITLLMLSFLKCIPVIERRVSYLFKKK